VTKGSSVPASMLGTAAGHSILEYLLCVTPSGRHAPAVEERGRCQLPEAAELGWKLRGATTCGSECFVHAPLAPATASVGSRRQRTGAGRPLEMGGVR